MLLRVEFLKPDGQPRYKQPMWLLWTGPTDVPLQELCKMYLWRFAIEHLFRFLKQNLGLNTSRSNDLVATEQWMWMCALAYWQLLLMRDLVEEARPAWYPAFSRWKTESSLPLDRCSERLYDICCSWAHRPKHPKSLEKEKVGTKGYHPAPRMRYPVIKKAQNRAKNRLLQAHNRSSG